MLLNYYLLSFSQMYRLTFLAFRLNDYGDSSHNSRTGYATSNGTARGRQSNGRLLSDTDSQDKRPRISYSRPSMQVTSSQLTKGSTNSGQDVPSACQLTHRKARNTKQLDVQSQSLAGSSLPSSGIGAEDADYASLIGAMDNDLDRPDPPLIESLQELSSPTVQTKGNDVCQIKREGLEAAKRCLRCLLGTSAGLESKGKLRGKAKAQKKKEEREKKSSVKAPGDDVKDNLADNDDSSSTTTETSNPDVETSIKEVPRHNSSSLPHNIKVVVQPEHVWRCTWGPLNQPLVTEGRGGFFIQSDEHKQCGSCDCFCPKKSHYAFLSLLVVTRVALALSAMKM